MDDLGCIDSYDFALPRELIAERPPATRDGARMLVLDRAAGTISHAWFRDFGQFVGCGDLVVLNNSRVIRARLPGDGFEVFLVESAGERRWRCLVKPGSKFRLGAEGRVAGSAFRVESIEEDGCRILSFDREPDHATHGEIPLPPYIKRPVEPSDAERYQTVFASEDGSVAAPTAGLHFTTAVLSQLPHAFLTLHVGLGTFLPVKTNQLADHHMHTERYHIAPSAAAAMNAAKRLIAVGTTTARVLESQPPGPIHPHTGTTGLFIRPPFAPRHAGALLTNFHLPRSTLLVLVCAFAGRELVLDAYREAVAARYRFFSYGDCMLVL